MRSRDRKLARRRLANRFAALPSIDKFVIPQQGWLRAMRDALGMTGRQLAARLGITPQSLGELERSEWQGSIRMSTLRKAAEALDCDLVYALVPRRPIEETIRERTRTVALRELGYVDRTMELEDQAVTAEDREERIANYIRDNVRDADLWDQP